MKKKLKESTGKREARTKDIIFTLHKLYPDATCALTHTNAIELLIATVLSAQCTDARVNLVTPTLFSQYRSAHEYADAQPEEIEKTIHSTGFFRNKTRNIIALSKALRDFHNGEVPQDMDALVALPGVGRKTANVVRSNWFGLPAIPVDTHVTRLSGRLELTESTHPNKIERDLMELVDKKEWSFLSHSLILHGRKTCRAAKPSCSNCMLEPNCPWPKS